MVQKYFLQVCSLSFPSFNGGLAQQSFLILMKPWSVLPVMDYAFSVKPTNSTLDAEKI